MRDWIWYAALLALIAALTPIWVQAQQQSGQQPGTTPAAAAAADDEEEEQLEHQRHSDPYLKYVQNAEVRISQLELGDFPTVRAFVSVADEGGVLIRSLTEQDFTVTENDVPAAEVRFGNREELNLPLSIQLVVDISSSMDVEVDHVTHATALDLAKQAVRDFVQQLGPLDRVGLITFSDAAIREVRMTTDHQDLIRAVDKLTAWGQTALWDATFSGMEELVDDETPSRRALIVLSDGWDNKSVESPLTILDWYEAEALDNNIGFSIYTLGLGPDVDRGALGNIATRTGGLYMDSPTADQLADVYQDILNQIQSEYLLEWDSPGESQPGQIIDVSIGITPVQSFTPGDYTYRSPGLTAALRRALLPGLITIGVLIAILVIATIFRISRRVWLTVMITPLEGKDYAVPSDGADIGTLESCEIRLPGDPALLPLHASLRESADGYVLAVVDPQSPIICGGMLLAKKLLRHGDRFTLGTTEFIFSERVSRPGDGEFILAEHVTDLEAPQQLSEEAQLAAAAGEDPAAAVERQVPAKLTAQSGPHAGVSVNLTEGETVIGRTEGQLKLSSDNQVSRKHCVITLAGGRATLTDPGSTNGTRINGKPCQPGMSVPVYAGDVLGIGSGEYRLE
ncbi:VWA domain-containing protein [bacterium]|nr:VWA domain-containing protein [bacterium]